MSRPACGPIHRKPGRISAGNAETYHIAADGQAGAGCRDIERRSSIGECRQRHVDPEAWQGGHQAEKKNECDGAGWFAQNLFSWQKTWSLVIVGVEAYDAPSGAEHRKRVDPDRRRPSLPALCCPPISIHAR